MTSLSDFDVYNLRRKEFLIESARQRLAAQALQGTAQRRPSRDLSPVLFVLTAMSAIAGWIATLG